MPNTTSFTQPADKGVNGPMKKMYKKALDSNKAIDPQFKLSKVNFAQMLELIVSYAEKNWVVSSFESTGLFPFSFKNCNIPQIVKNVSKSVSNEVLGNDALELVSDEIKASEQIGRMTELEHSVSDEITVSDQLDPPKEELFIQNKDLLSRDSQLTVEFNFGSEDSFMLTLSQVTISLVIKPAYYPPSRTFHVKIQLKSIQIEKTTKI